MNPAPGAIMPLKVLDASGAGLVSDAIASLDYAVAMGAGEQRFQTLLLHGGAP